MWRYKKEDLGFLQSWSSPDFNNMIVSLYFIHPPLRMYIFFFDLETVISFFHVDKLLLRVVELILQESEFLRGDDVHA